jgi:hypothetical protein
LKAPRPVLLVLFRFYPDSKYGPDSGMTFLASARVPGTPNFEKKTVIMKIRALENVYPALIKVFNKGVVLITFFRFEKDLLLEV